MFSQKRVKLKRLSVSQSITKKTTRLKKKTKNYEFLCFVVRWYYTLEKFLINDLKDRVRQANVLKRTKKTTIITITKDGLKTFGQETATLAISANNNKPVNINRSSSQIKPTHAQF